MEASSEGGFGLFMMGRSKGNRVRQDPKLGNVLSSILKEKERHTLETRLLACQSLNYLIKMDIRVSDGKKTNEWMLQYLAVMDEMARLDGESKLQKQLAEESANGLESLCQSHPFVFRELCNAEPLECLLHFVSYANTLHLNVLLTSLSMLLKVCQKVHIQEKPRKTSRQCSSDQSSLGSIMSTLLRCIHHANPRVQMATIKCITTLYHRTPLHAYMTADCIRQLLRIMVETSNDDTLDASRAAVSLLTELIDESALLLSTVMLSDVYEPLTQQVAAILQSESVATPTLRFLSKLTSRMGQRAGGATKTNEVLHRFLLAFVKANAISTVSALLKDGADLHESPSPLLIAVSDSSLSMVRLLVKKGADVTGQALHIAAEAKRCDVVSLLLQHGANPASLNEAGETLHQVVAKYPDHPVAKLLAMYDGHDSEDHAPPPVSLTASTTSPGSQVLISDFSREWNDMDTEEEEESEHYDEDMHSEDEYHDMYGDEDESHDDEEEDEEDDEMLDEESKDDDDSSLHLEDKDEVLSKQENDLSVIGEPIWKQVDGKWIEAMVCGFDPTSGCHLLYMSEEYVEEVLQEETYRLVKTPMKVYGNVEIDLNHFGSTPSLKRKTEDGQVRRSKRIKRKALEESAVSAVAISSPQDTDGQHNEETDEVKIRERRLLDVLKLHDSSSPAEGDKVWVSSGSDICVCVNVPLVVAESNFVQYQANARPGAAASPPIPHFRAANKKGKQKAKSHLPLITKSQEDFTVLAPPVVRVLLGYGEFSDKPDEQRNWLISDDHLNEEVQPVLRWLFHAFAAGERPDAKPHSLDVPAETPTWPLAVFSAFCEEVKLGFMASEEWTLFSHYLDQLGFKRTSLQKEQKEPIQLFEFAAEDNLFYCLHTIHPNQNLGSMPWKIVFNVYCDYRITWEDEKKTTNKSNANTSLSKSGETSSWGPVFAQSINLLETLYRSYGAEQSKELWLNPRLSRKLRMQLQDVLSITSGTYPTWCDALVQKVCSRYSHAI
ncbi:unnamed protein product [Aphanomyces euteiches]